LHCGRAAAVCVQLCSAEGREMEMRARGDNCKSNTTVTSPAEKTAY